MTPAARRFRLLFFGPLALFIVSMLSITGYTLWRLQGDALHNGLDKAALYTRNTEDFLTQSLRVTALPPPRRCPPAPKHWILQGWRAASPPRCNTPHFCAPSRCWMHRAASSPAPIRPTWGLAPRPAAWAPCPACPHVRRGCRRRVFSFRLPWFWQGLIQCGQCRVVTGI